MYLNDYRQVSELMTTGEITFPRPEADMLRNIRNGLFSKEVVTELYEESRAFAEETREKSILPDKPDSESVWEEYTQLVKEAIVGELK